MSDIDLIPKDYRERLTLLKGLRRFGILYLVLAVSIVTLRGGLAYALRIERGEAERLEAAEQQVQSQRARLSDLRREKAEVEKRLAVLTALRGGVAARDMFVAVDRALDPDVWFLSWTFGRAGEVVEETPEATHAGYFIVLPAQKQDGPRKGWLIGTHLEIRAQARNHSTLANFVTRLVRQPEIESVRVLNTRVRSYGGSDVVDFEVAVVVRTQA